MSAPAVAVSASGNQFTAVWKDVRAGEPNVYWAISDEPGLAEGQLVHDETRGSQDHPSLCIDASGAVWVAWEDSRDGQQSIRIRSSRDGDRGRQLSDSGEVATFPTIVTGKNFVAVVYESRNEDYRTIKFRMIKVPRDLRHTLVEEVDETPIGTP